MSIKCAPNGYHQIVKGVLCIQFPRFRVEDVSHDLAVTAVNDGL